MSSGLPTTPRTAAATTATVLAALAVAPAVLPEFWLTNILDRALIYGIIALSLTFLAHYGGFVSLAQMAIAGVAGYTVAISVPEAIPASRLGLSLSYAVAVPLALLASTVAGLLVGAIAVRTREVYLLMITLAIAVSFYYGVQTNLEYLNGYEGIRNVLGPQVLGLPFRDPLVFHGVTLGTAALLYGAVLYLVGSPFGLVLQGLRDNARRMSALGYHVALHRIAAFGLAGLIAGCGGILSTIYNIGISPGQVSTHATIGILIMAVVGGLGHPVGAFVGALIFTLVDTFSASIYDRDRFNTLIGAVFLVIVLVSPDGVVGAVARGRALAQRLATQGRVAWQRTGRKREALVSPARPSTDS
ncbi:branched-chain amino acid ABC transporter permease [Methylibium petroleiphilum]|uniref:branched-chain amino acid ABC transporter permease n=1 Tax=Methylibium petroleiphilum TaxID=105560 RepID=UPI001AC5BDE1|nr:branched-chain amino acid ABC transporter permease [Methylibium petroleiphilum]MBN9206013.1 branched-chain amino acid ABC transporter permease [Methylibium petroleiphilum]